jgi:ferritin-like metal-binding protein YciE
MNENDKETKHVCSICGQERKQTELISIPGNNYCIFCYQVLKEWATQIGYDRKTLIGRLDKILHDLATEKKEENK